MEQRDPQAVPFAQTLVELFKDRFRDIQYTLHPADMPGEAAGKSSNISWAAREAIFKHKSSPNWKDTLMTVMDSKLPDIERLGSSPVGLNRPFVNIYY